MNTPRQSPKTPQARLRRLAQLSQPFRRQLGGPRYLIGVGLILIIAALIAVGLIGGKLGGQVFSKHVQQVLKWARPDGR